MAKKQPTLPTLTSRYIEILEYADSHTVFTINQMAKDLHLDTVFKEIIMKKADLNVMFQQHHGEHLSNNGEPAGVYKYYQLSKDECFQLLEYRELQEARASSLTATRYATAALVVSICALFFDIIWTWYCN